MFTGLVSYTGIIKSIKHSSSLITYGVECQDLLAVGEIKKSSSVAVNGICQTVTAINKSALYFDAVESSIQKTTIGKWKHGMCVHLEPALQVGDSIDGHFVQGHVNGIAEVRSIRKTGGAYVFQFKASKAITNELINEGSVCIDGISLTISHIQSNGFEVNIIPETYASTNFNRYRIGTKVNIETDMLLRSHCKQIIGWSNSMAAWGYV